MKQDLQIHLLIEEENSDQRCGSEVSVFASLEEAEAALKNSYKATINALGHDESIQKGDYCSEIASRYASIVEGQFGSDSWSWRIETHQLSMPAPATVLVDKDFGEMLNWAIRYSLGRCTYAAADTANYVLRHVSLLDTHTLWAAREDIRKAPTLGHEMDACHWRRLLDAIEEELRERDLRDRT